MIDAEPVETPTGCFAGSGAGHVGDDVTLRAVPVVAVRVAATLAGQAAGGTGIALDQARGALDRGDATGIRTLEATVVVHGVRVPTAHVDGAGGRVGGVGRGGVADGGLVRGRRVGRGGVADFGRAAFRRGVGAGVGRGVVDVVVAGRAVVVDAQDTGGNDDEEGGDREQGKVLHVRLRESVSSGQSLAGGW